jgi:hypothetical protein
MIGQTCLGSPLVIVSSITALAVHASRTLTVGTILGHMHLLEWQCFPRLLFYLGNGASSRAEP